MENKYFNADEEFNIDLDAKLEGNKLDAVLSMLFLAVWILSILMLINQNYQGN